MFGIRRLIGAGSNQSRQQAHQDNGIDERFRNFRKSITTTINLTGSGGLFARLNTTLVIGFMDHLVKAKRQVDSTQSLDIEAANELYARLVAIGAEFNDTDPIEFFLEILQEPSTTFVKRITKILDKNVLTGKKLNDANQRWVDSIIKGQNTPLIEDDGEEKTDAPLLNDFLISGDFKNYSAQTLIQVIRKNPYGLLHLLQHDQARLIEIITYINKIDPQRTSLIINKLITKINKTFTVEYELSSLIESLNDDTLYLLTQYNNIENPLYASLNTELNERIKNSLFDTNTITFFDQQNFDLSPPVFNGATLVLFLEQNQQYLFEYVLSVKNTNPDLFNNICNNFVTYIVTEKIFHLIIHMNENNLSLFSETIISECIKNQPRYDDLLHNYDNNPCIRTSYEKYNTMIYGEYNIHEAYVIKSRNPQGNIISIIVTNDFGKGLLIETTNDFTEKLHQSNEFINHMSEVYQAENISPIHLDSFPDFQETFPTIHRAIEEAKSTIAQNNPFYRLINTFIEISGKNLDKNELRKSAEKIASTNNAVDSSAIKIDSYEEDLRLHQLFSDIEDEMILEIICGTFSNNNANLSLEEEMSLALQTAAFMARTCAKEKLGTASGAVSSLRLLAAKILIIFLKTVKNIDRYSELSRIVHREIKVLLGIGERTCASTAADQLFNVICTEEEHNAFQVTQIEGNQVVREIPPYDGQFEIVTQNRNSQIKLLRSESYLTPIPLPPEIPQNHGFFGMDNQLVELRQLHDAEYPANINEGHIQELEKHLEIMQRRLFPV